MKTTINLFFGSLFLLSSTILQAQEIRTDTLQPYIERLMQELEVPGMSVAIVKDGEIIYSEAFGTKTIGEKDPVDVNTLFGIGSISKSITALALGILVDEGKLEWDDKVRDHLPYFELYDPYVSSSFSIRDLLTHRSGLTSVSGGLLWYDTPLDKEEVVRRMKYLKPVDEFRGNPAYQNITYVVAGVIIEKISGQSWDDFVKERIFEPLGMQHTRSLYSDITGSANVSTPHTKSPDWKLLPIKHRNHDNLGPAGGIYSTSEDMAQYMKLMLNEGVFEGDTIVSRKVVQEILKPQIFFQLFPEPIHNEFTAYGFGWWLTPVDGHKVVEHSGGVDGMVANLKMITDQGFGIVALSNAEESATTALTLNVLGDALDKEEDYGKFAQRIVSNRKARKARALEQQEKLLQQQIKGTDPLEEQLLLGNYSEEMYGEILVRKNAKGKLELAFSMTPAFTGELSHWHHNMYRIDWYDPMVPSGFVSFILDPEGKVKEMELDQPQLLDVDFEELGVIRKVE